MTEQFTPPTSPAPAMASMLGTTVEHVGDGIVVRQTLGTLVVEMHRRPWLLIGLLTLFCAFWDLAVVLLFLNTAPSIFWLTHGLAGAAMTAMLINLAINQTRITCDHGLLTVERWPLRFLGQRHEVALVDVERVCAADGRTAGSDESQPALWMELRDGRHKVLIDVLSDEAHGHRLAHLINEQLVR